MMWNFKTKLVLLMLLLFPLLTGLGFWQLNRYQEKLDLEAQLAARQQSALHSPGTLRTLDDPRFYRVQAEGRYLDDQTFLLDNRIHKGRSGYHVITPFMTHGGQLMLVIRGWLAGSPDKAQIPAIPSIQGNNVLDGLAWQPAGKAFLLGEDHWAESWPKVIQALDIQRMGDALEAIPEAWYMVLDEQQPGSLTRDFHPINMQPGKHLGYAIQWFLMALVMLGIGGYYLKTAGRTHDKGH